MDIKLLSASIFQHVGSSLGIDVGLALITSSGWLLVSAVLAQMAYLVANITFAITRSVVMKIASLAQREISGILHFSDGLQHSLQLLPSVLLLTIVVAIVGVAVVVVVAGAVVAGAVVESSSVVKLSFVVSRYLHWSMLTYLIH
ncbi:hypothetical protein Tco_0189132 [Tanacetum coccineum]